MTTVFNALRLNTDKSLQFGSSSGGSIKRGANASDVAIESGAAGAVNITSASADSSWSNTGNLTIDAAGVDNVLFLGHANNGKVQVENNLDVTGTLEVTGDSTLAVLNAQATTLNSLDVTTTASVTGTLGVTGDSTLAVLNAQATTLNSLNVTTTASVTGTLGVTGDSTLAVLNAQATTLNSLDVTTTASVAGNLTVTGDLTVDGVISGDVSLDSITTSDNMIIINDGAVGSTSVDTGIQFKLDAGSYAVFYYDTNANIFKMNNAASETTAGQVVPIVDGNIGLEIGTLSVVSKSTASAGAIVVTQNANQPMLSLTQSASNATASVFALSAYSAANDINGPLVSPVNLGGGANSSLVNVEGKLYMKVTITDSYNAANSGDYYITLNKITT